MVSGLLFPAASRASTTTWDLQSNWSENAGNPVPGQPGLPQAWSYRNLAGGLFSLFQTNIAVPLWSGVALPTTPGLTRWTDASNSNAGLAATSGFTCAEGGLPAPNCSGIQGVSWPTGTPSGSIGGVSYDIEWTAPYATTITVNADIWMMRNIANNLQTLRVKLGTTNEGTINVPSASRANGSGAASPLTLINPSAYGAGFLQAITVTAGETLDFIVGPGAGAVADFVGMDIRIDAGAPLTDPPPPVPEPASLGFMASGLAAIGLFLRRRKA